MLRSLHSLFVVVSIPILSFAVIANAEMDDTGESIVSGINARGEKIFVIRYQENRVWRVEEIIQHADGWQDLVSRRYFNTRTEAERTQVQRQSQFSQLQRINPLLEGSSEIVLQGGSLWPTTQAWNWDWEKKYAQWLKENMDVDFYKRYNIATDCADVVFSARWIFARIHGLPVANRISGSGTLLTNQSMRPEWEKLPTAKNWYEDKRFRAALNYLLNMTYTHSLMRDSYPIAVTADYFIPGTYNLNVADVSGHAQLVHRVDLSDSAIAPYLIIQSTTPRKVRALNESLSWEADQAKKGRNGFLRMLWPKVKNGTYILEKPENMPGYSLEQYAPGFIREEKRPNFLEILFRLKPNLNFVTLVKTGYQNLKEMFNNRVGIVEEGYGHCPRRSCAPESQLYDDWSTPSRDRHIMETIQQLSIFESFPLSDRVRQEVTAAARQAKNAVALNLAGENYTLKSLIFAWKNKMYSSDPNDEPGTRWGISPEAFRQRIQQDLNKILNERKIKISKEADNQLRQLLVVSNTYCQYFSQDQCQRLRVQELAKPMQVIGQTRSLQEWLEHSLWLNADPKQSPENQWGALRATAKYQRIADDVQEFIVTKEGVGLMRTLAETQIGPMGSHGIEPATLPTGFTWQSLVREESVGWATSVAQVLRWDFKTGAQVIYPLPQLGDIKIIRAQSHHLLVESQGRLWSLQVQGAQLVSVWNAGMSAGHLENENFYLGKAANGAWQILDFAKATPEVIVSAEDLSEAKVFKATSQYIGIVSDKKYLFYERASGRVSEVTGLDGVPLLWSEGLSKVIVANVVDFSFDLVSLDARFNVVSSQKLGIFGNIQGDLAIIFLGDSTPKLFKMQGESLVEQSLLSDEVGFAQLATPWVLVKMKSDGDFRLRSADGNEVLYEGERVIPLMTKGVPLWGLTINYQERDMRLISLKNPKAPSMMMGEFVNRNGTFFDESLFSGQAVDRGVVLTYQGFRFWVEL